MAAFTAGQRGKRVLLIELSNKLGKKILMSGGGRCNFTNLEIHADNFICPNPHFVKSALAQYTQWDFIGMVATHGVAYHEKDHGQLFCDKSAKDILKILVDECLQVDVDMRLNCEVNSVKFNESYQLFTSQGEFSASSLVVATGGLSIPTLGGASGFGYDLAKQFSLLLNKTEASLVPMTLSGRWQEFSAALSGVSLPVYVSVPGKGFTESLLFTHRGLSGPSILQLSNYWYLGEVINIDLVPSDNVTEVLLAAKVNNPNKTVNGVLSAYFPKSLLSALQQLWWTELVNTTLHEIKNQQLEAIGQQLNNWNIVPSGTEGYRTAEVTRGGIDVNLISSKTMEVKNQAGLFFVGEVLDVTGHLGGYNFQWAWSSGYVAGVNA
jgi:predicted Rossmann fold flavoprotein